MSKQPEGKLSLDIIKTVKKKGGYVWKVHGNEYTPAGTPDIVGVYRAQFVAFETKMPGNRLSAIQEYRIEKFRESGGLVVAPCRSTEAALELLNGIDQFREGSLAWHRLMQRWGQGAGFPA